MSLAPHIRDIVIHEGFVSEEKLRQLEEKYHDESRTHTAEILTTEGILSDEALYEMVADRLGVSFRALKPQDVSKELFERFPVALQETHQFVPLKETDHGIEVATLDPHDIETKDLIERATGKEVTYVLTTPSDLGKVLRAHHKGLEESVAEITTGTHQRIVKDAGKGVSTVKLVDAILDSAIVDGASDIHVEPSERDVSIRFRVDGVLKRVMTLPRSQLSGFVARIKVLSNLKLDEHRLPQDGRFKLATAQYKVSFRVSIFPVFDGEKIVMRLLDESQRFTSLDQLGLNPSALAMFKRNIQKPHGMVLVTGPTGSGKTTTLYTALEMLNDVKVNISTIEDPIEYRLEGVNQSQVNTKIGFTFAGGLRALLRQDPNIILVGEIRDNETAKIAINAAMTGHLVLSTLHTNDAVTTLPRMMEMDVPSFLVADTTNIVVAQRLVRRICSECITSFTPDAALIKNVEAVLRIPSLAKHLEELDVRKTSSDEPLLFYKGKGCATCGQEGYRGRLGIYEVLEMTPTMRQLILSNASSEQVLEKATSQGMITMMDDALMKSIQGKTTLEEILRVTQE
ncbi:MAG: type II/IV secretion system protein [Candidatus Kerfeldbacteria bacterium]|nr:type II/IV secretion system protein [Candidatus Kerfeldbacteria bacterium]